MNSLEWNKRKIEFVTYENNRPSITLSPEAEVALRLLPFVIADYTNASLKTQIMIAQDLAKKFMNYKPE